ncbi:glycosyltransferase family 2 protein [candidate division WOR-3 bacterium]|jgi:GT2 family glycosyltransferase|nr:glycosyltransferase family 2 protein [candidate division WOR-3 bacterium]
MIDVSLIYVNYFSSNEIINSILSFKRMHKKLNYEIIIVNNSASGTEHNKLNIFQKTNNIIVIHLKKNYGFAKACNIGANTAKGKFLFFVNPDTIFYKGKITDLIKFYKSNNDCGIVAPVLLNSDYSIQYSARRFPSLINQIGGRNSLFNTLFPRNKLSSDYMYKNINYNRVQIIDWVRAAAILINKDLFLSVGGFSEYYFMFVEDIDLSKKLSTLGYKTYIVPDMKIIHLLGTIVDKDPIKKIWMHNKSLYIYFSKLYKFTILKYILYYLVLFRIIILTAIKGALKYD